MTIKKIFLLSIIAISFSNVFCMQKRKITGPKKQVSFTKDTNFKDSKKWHTNGYNEPCNCLTVYIGCCSFGLIYLGSYGSKYVITELNNYFNGTQS